MEAKLIEIAQDLPGFDHFIGSWVCQDDLNIIVDVGPANTAKRLIDSLTATGLYRMDYILLTHIHLDHAGGLFEILSHYPMARAVCHEKALTYLVDPSKLWAGSRKALGEIAEAYGPPRAVDRKRLIPHLECRIKDLTVLETPGHASHHLSFQYQNQIFLGEAGGNFLKIEEQEYLRPATPLRFFLDVTLKSVDRLLSLDDQPLCYAHFGRARSSHLMLVRFRDQLMRWKEVVSKELISGNSDLMKRCVEALLEKDSCLKAFQLMSKDHRKRERFFMANSVKGFLGYLRDQKEGTASEESN